MRSTDFLKLQGAGLRQPRLARDAARPRRASTPSTLYGSTRRICRSVELIWRRRMLQKALKKAGPALRFSEHLEGVACEAMFRPACALGLEGIVAKKLMSPLQGGSPAAAGAHLGASRCKSGFVHELGEGQESGPQAAQRRASARRRSRKCSRSARGALWNAAI